MRKLRVQVCDRGVFPVQQHADFGLDALSFVLAR
jgi:hypothetical protein